VTLVGLLPAAGAGVRLRPYRAPKELLPLLLKGPDGRPVTTPVCHWSLSALAEVPVDRCLVVISEEKRDLVRLLGDGSDLGLSIGYVVQKEPLGLTHVVRSAEPWLEGAEVILALPDTVFFPKDAPKRITDELRRSGADLVLAVFPTEEPERLAPVEIEASGEIRAIHDKPGDRRLLNTWGLCAWSPRFTDFCADWDRRPERTGVLSDAMNAAKKAGLQLRAIELSGGAFCDVGTPEGLASTVELLMARGPGYTR
jgi:glucose-1-phosphate thymidylyltransferase